MNVETPKDVLGRDLDVGSFVCYTTNSRDSGLQFGIIKKIKEDANTRHDGTVDYSHRIQLVLCKPDGTPLYRTHNVPEAEVPLGATVLRRWLTWRDNKAYAEYETDEKQISGLVQHSEYKFYLMP